MKKRPVPDADDAELKGLFLDSRKHLPRTIFDPRRWEKIAGPAWRKVVYVLNRGAKPGRRPSPTRLKST